MNRKSCEQRIPYKIYTFTGVHLHVYTYFFFTLILSIFEEMPERKKNTSLFSIDLKKQANKEIRMFHFLVKI